VARFHHGRIVLPAATRAALGLVPGQRLVARVEGRSLILRRPEDAVEQLRRLGGSVPAGRSLVDELLAERRAAASVE
jgi:antitoxin PrlF